MDYEQLTLIDVPSSTPSNVWEMEDGDDCHHYWLKSHNQHGLFCYRCYYCKELRSPDLFLDRNVMLSFAEKRKEEFLHYFLSIKPAMPKVDQDRYRRAAHVRYWQAKLSFLRIGITDWGIDEEVEARFPIPPDLIEVRDSLVKGNTPNHTESELSSSCDKSAENFARGNNTPSNITPSNITPSKKSRRDKGEGSGWLLNKPVHRNGKTYDQWWFQYEVAHGKQKPQKRSLYISGKKLSQVKALNDQRAPIDDILEVITNKS